MERNSRGDFTVTDMTRKRTSETDLAVSGAGPATPVRRKTAARPRAKRAAEPVETLASTVVAERETVMPRAEAALAPVVEVSYEEIAKLAYSYWEARGFQGGCPDEDWFRAEVELRHRSAAAAVA